ncbi:ABC-type multidrug transport system, ATPase and permease component [Friedmanniella luteola]|uniref:ABC-type multidrug transport system, ATPase and permease component n=1 Tax=Friedmanniella luteola TaxID=546871 RepID=A0A1H1L429_9ACTN|nr:ABC transporter ATP-binding protein [Friedmanniella luteola]SDR69032.1 ABC-type multidrug transport system, ATPase and permease component [Friedmanniella luteola]
MQDFPPVVPDFEDAAVATPTSRAAADVRPDVPRHPRSRGDFSHPDTRSPSRFLLWLLRQQRSAIVLLTGVTVLQWLPGAVGPYVVGRIIDDGISPRDLDVVVRLCAVLLGLVVLGAVAGVLSHTLIVRTWLVAMYGSTKLVTRKVAQMGHVLPQRTPTGEVLSVASGDADQFGGLNELLANLAGAVVAYLVIAGLVLSTSWQLGLVVLVAAPLIVVFALPLLRPLQRRQEAERSRSADLTSLATDIVAGLRILRGIGGEQTFARNYAAQSQLTRSAGLSAGRWQAAVDATSVLFSGLFLVALTWLGARQVVAGQLSVGQLVSFFGYAVFMVWPIQTFFQSTQKWVRCLVSARKAIAVLEQQPPWTPPAEPLRLPGDGVLHDQRSGFTARPGELTLVVSALPDDSAALADRLGRYLPAEYEPVALDVEGVKGRAAKRARAQQQADRVRLAERDRRLASGSWGVSLGPVDLADVPLTEVRRTVLVSDAASVVFAGTLQELVDPHDRLTRAEAEGVLHAAAAEDVFEGLPGGWQGTIDERGRGLSGGQRQRLVLARALGLNPPVLVLVEPTSAVDAHTEALIASRLADHRAGRTTVVTSVSPLLLHHADRVAYLEDGVVAASGTHEELVSTSAGYRSVVARALDEDGGRPAVAGETEHAVGGGEGR